MPDTNSLVWVYLKTTIGLSGNDTTSQVRTQMDTLTGEATARLKAIIASAGAAN